MSKYIIEAENVKKYFPIKGGVFSKVVGYVKAVDDVSLKIEKGTCMALVGESGCGKTTFGRTLLKLIEPDAGKILFEGKDITGLPPYKIAHAGIGRSFQVTNIFSRMTVRQNILSALIAHYGKGASLFSPYWRDAKLTRETDAILAQLGLSEFSDVETRYLSYGDKRLVEIGIVLANYPRLILLDEPAAGMTPEETERMTALIQRLADETKTTFFLTEHDMKVVFSVSRKIFVLHQGQLLAQGTPQEIRENRKVKEAYLGGSLDA